MANSGSTHLRIRTKSGDLYLEEFDQLGNLLLGFLDVGDVLECDLVLFLVQHAGAAFAKASRTSRPF